MSKLYYSYDDIHNLIKKGSEDIKLSNFKPDLILAIGGGGFIPARILRTFMDDIPMISLTINFYDKDNNITETPNIIQMIDRELIKNKKVLIVDEIDDTRKTLGYLLEYFSNNNYNFEELGIFVINNKIKDKLYKINNEIRYYSCIDIDDIWVVYPWE